MAAPFKGERVKRWKGERVKRWLRTSLVNPLTCQLVNWLRWKGEKVKGWKGERVKRWLRTSLVNPLTCQLANWLRWKSEKVKRWLRPLKVKRWKMAPTTSLVNLSTRQLEKAEKVAILLQTTQMMKQTLASRHPSLCVRYSPFVSFVPAVSLLPPLQCQLSSTIVLSLCRVFVALPLASYC